MKKKCNRSENNIVLLKLSLYCISLWILMFMLIVLKINIPEFTDKGKLQIVLEFVETNVFICWTVYQHGVRSFVHPTKN